MISAKSKNTAKELNGSLQMEQKRYFSNHRRTKTLGQVPSKKRDYP
jgi:hypothetical protein